MTSYADLAGEENPNFLNSSTFKDVPDRPWTHDPIQLRSPRTATMESHRRIPPETSLGGQPTPPGWGSAVRKIGESDNAADSGCGQVGTQQGLDQAYGISGGYGFARTTAWEAIEFRRRRWVPCFSDAYDPSKVDLYQLFASPSARQHGWPWELRDRKPRELPFWRPEASRDCRGSSLRAAPIYSTINAAAADASGVERLRKRFAGEGWLFVRWLQGRRASPPSATSQPTKGISPRAGGGRHDDVGGRTAAESEARLDWTVRAGRRDSGAWLIGDTVEWRQKQTTFADGWK